MINVIRFSLFVKITEVVTMQDYSLKNKTEVDILKEAALNNNIFPNTLYKILQSAKIDHYSENGSSAKRRQRIKEEIIQYSKEKKILSDDSALKLQVQAVDFIELKLNNYKTYYGKQTLNFKMPVQSEENIILVGGMNGAGKTTILKALRVLLYGKRNMTDLEYKEQFANTINNRFFSEGGRESSAELTLSVDSDYTHTIKLVWQYDNAKRMISETRTLIKRRNGSIRPISNNIITNNNLDTFNRLIDGWLPLESSPYFIFDGEEISTLVASRNSTKFKDAINRMIGLMFYDNLKSDIDFIVKDYERSLAKMADSAKVNRINKMVGALKIELKEAEEKLERVDMYLSGRNTKLSDLRKQRNDILMKNRDTRDVIVKEISQLEERLKNEKNNLSMLYKKNIIPTILKDKINLLSKRLNEEQLAQEKVIRSTAALKPYEEFMNQLLAKPLSPALTEQQLVQIQELGKTIWMEDHNISKIEEVEVLHDITNDTKRMLSNLASNAKADQIKNVIRNISKYENDLKNLNRRVSLAPSAVDASEIEREIEVLNRDVGDKEKTRRVRRNKVNQIKEELTKLMHELRRLGENIESDSELQKKYDFSKRVQNAVNHYTEQVLNWKVALISFEFKEMLSALFRKQNEFGNAYFDEKSMCIRIKNEAGTEIPIEERSAGEKQIISSAFIWAMTKASDLDLPVVIDTPLGRLDSHHRNNLITHFYRKLSKQVVILSTDTEITKEYMELMEQNTAKQLMLDYNEQEKYTVIREGYFEFTKGVS